MTEKEGDKLKLCEEDRRTRGRIIAAGAINAFMRINVEVSAALLAGCLLTLLVIVITILPCIRAADYSCRNDNEQTTATNVYFLRYAEERRWTDDEMCWIEVAARRYPQFNIFMINLRKKDESEEISNVYIEELFGNFITMKSGYQTNSRSKLLEIPNVRNIDISVTKFFAGSILSSLIKNATCEEIELAAKFHVIWNSSGISLEPRNIAQLDSLLYFFDDQIDLSATVQIDEDLQAASVPCQSFIGLVIKEMSRGFADRQTIVKRAISNFCPRLSNCAGVRIIEAKPAGIKELAECPIIRSYVNGIQ